MKQTILLLSIGLLISCSKIDDVSIIQPNTTTTTTTTTTTPTPTVQTNLVYPLTVLDSISYINKTTSWYNTNRSFDRLFDITRSRYWGFQSTPNGFVPFSISKTADYWNDYGGYLYTDMNGDNKKDLWAFYYKHPWPQDQPGLQLFSEYELYDNDVNIQLGLKQVRKCVLTDLNNDKRNEIVLFSSGYDKSPYSGDVIGIFDVSKRKYDYLTEDVGYFHGGATGDIDNDGDVDIIGYCGNSEVLIPHPTAYLNVGNGVMKLSNTIFSNINRWEDIFYTVELYDINNDGFLDLLLGGIQKLKIVFNRGGRFDFKDCVLLPIENGIEIMDIDFLDFDKDGRMDILTMSNFNKYKGYSVNVFLQKEINRFTDETKSYINYPLGSAVNHGWIKWIHLFDFDKDGDIDIVGDGIFGDLFNSNSSLVTVYWKNEQGKFNMVLDIRTPSPN